MPEINRSGTAVVEIVTEEEVLGVAAIVVVVVEVGGGGGGREGGGIKLLWRVSWTLRYFLISRHDRRNGHQSKAEK